MITQAAVLTGLGSSLLTIGLMALFVPFPFPHCSSGSMTIILSTTSVCTSAPLMTVTGPGERTSSVVTENGWDRILGDSPLRGAVR